MTEERKTYTITDAEIRWASPFTPNKRSKKMQIDFCNLSKKDVQGLTQLGLKVKQKEDTGFYITCKSKIPMKILDEDGEPMKEDVKIGNGSIAKAIIYAYDWKFEGSTGKSPGMVKAKVTKLVEWVGGADFDDEKDFSDMKDDIPF